MPPPDQLSVPPPFTTKAELARTELLLELVVRYPLTLVTPPPAVKTPVTLLVDAVEAGVPPARLTVPPPPVVRPMTVLLDPV